MKTACDRCGGPFTGIMWGQFTARGVLIGDICEACRCVVMADYMLPCAYRAHGEQWVSVGGDERSMGERLSAAAQRLRSQRLTPPQTANAKDSE